jgi:hypothetical protein
VTALGSPETTGGQLRGRGKDLLFDFKPQAIPDDVSDDLSETHDKNTPNIF